MRIALAGDIDGQILSAQHTVESLGGADWLIASGFGTWPDPARLDRATRKHSGPGDFARLYVSGWQAPIQTLYISGSHEDHRWLHRRYTAGHMEVLNNVHWLANGHRTTIGDWDTTLRVTGLGRVYSESTFNGKLNKKSHRHFTRAEFEKACASGPTDLLVLYEPPNEVTKKVIFATRPKLVVHTSRQPEHYELMKTEVIGITKGGIHMFEYKDSIFQKIS